MKENFFSVNPHEVKHWMDPDIIPFGWGLYEDGDEPGKPDKGLIFLNSL